MLPLLSAKPAVTFPAAQHHRPFVGTKLYCFITEAHKCEQLAQDCYAALPKYDLNQRPVDRKSNTLYPMCHRAISTLAKKPTYSTPRKKIMH